MKFQPTVVLSTVFHKVLTNCNLTALLVCIWEQIIVTVKVSSCVCLVNDCLDYLLWPVHHSA